MWIKAHAWTNIDWSSLRSDFMSPDDEGHFAAPRVDEAGPAGVQGDMVPVLTAQAHWRVLKWRLACVLQNCVEE